jgi:hypothetical protein
LLDSKGILHVSKPKIRHAFITFKVTGSRKLRIDFTAFNQFSGKSTLLNYNIALIDINQTIIIGCVACLTRIMILTRKVNTGVKIAVRDKVC